jgi:hypothetical protein
MDMWKANTNYTVLNQSPYVWDKKFTKFIKNRPVIVVTTAQQFLNKSINDTLEFMITHEFVPIVVADDKDAIENNIYTALSSEIKSAVLYTRNEKNKDYEKLIKIAQGYLLGKGIIEDDNTTLRTPEEGEGTTTKE